MGVTATYNFPYPELGDPPNGPVQINALAQAVEDQLEITDATVISRSTVYREARSAGDETVTTVDTDVAGATLTFTTPTVNTVVSVESYWDVATTGGTDTFIGTIMVDGVTNTTGEAHAEGEGSSGRVAISQGWTVTLAAAGSHTIKLRRQKASNSDTLTLFGIHTKIKVQGPGLT